MDVPSSPSSACILIAALLEIRGDEGDHKGQYISMKPNRLIIIAPIRGSFALKKEALFTIIAVFKELH
jgi:hypothetical protein